MAITEESSKTLGFPCQRMPSGAGHDAAIVAERKKSSGAFVPVGMLFIPCKEGKSHCPEEYTSTESIAKGTMVLCESLRRLAVE